MSAIAKRSETYRQYKASLTGSYIGIFERYPEYHDPSDATTYLTSQVFGETVRSLGSRSAIAGLRYQSVRHSGHENWVCFRTAQVRDVVQADQFGLEVPEHGSVAVLKRS